MASNRTAPVSLTSAFLKLKRRTKVEIALIGIALMILGSRAHFSMADKAGLDENQSTSADHAFLTQFNLSLSEPLKAKLLVGQGAVQWMNLVTLWARSSRLLSFRDVLKALPPPAEWPALQTDAAHDAPGLSPQQAEMVRIAGAILNGDRSSEDRYFNELLSLLEKNRVRPRGPALVELLRLWDCLLGSRRDSVGASRSELNRWLILAQRSGYSPTRPFEQVYIPNLSILGDQAEVFAERMLVLPSKLFLVTPDAETQRILRTATARKISQISCLPVAWYQEETNWGEFAKIAKQYRSSHPDTFLNGDALSLLFCTELKEGVFDDGRVAEWYQVIENWVTPMSDDSVYRVLIHGLSAPAFSYMAHRVKENQLQWVAHRCGLFALMSNQDRDFEDLVGNYPDKVVLTDALLTLHLRRGKYDRAYQELNANLQQLEGKTSFHLGIQEPLRQALLLHEISEMLMGGCFLHRPEWTAAGLARASQEFDALHKLKNLSKEFKPVCYDDLLRMLIETGLDDPARRELDALSKSGVSLSYQIFPEKLRLAYRQKDWKEILALAHDFPAQFTSAQNVVLRSSLAGDIPTTASAILAQAEVETGHPEKAAPYLQTDLLAGQFSVPVLGLAARVFGVPQAAQLVKNSSASNAHQDLAEAFLGDPEPAARVLDGSSLDPADLAQTDYLNLRVAALGRLAKTAAVENTPASPNLFTDAARDWRLIASAPILYEENFYSKMVQDEELTAPLLSRTPVLSFKLALELELTGQVAAAVHYYDLAFSAPARSQNATKENSSTRWLGTIPILSSLAISEIHRLDHPSLNGPPATAFSLCLEGLAAYQNADNEHAFESFQGALRLEPKNLLACRYVLKLSDRIQVPAAMTQIAMETILASGQRADDQTGGEFNLSKLWDATARWAKDTPQEQGESAPPAGPIFDLNRALFNLANKASPRRMSAIVDTAALTSCSNILDNLP